MTNAIIGLAAAALTMFSFVPQIIKISGTKSAKDVSIVTILQLSGGVCLWIAYGFLQKDAIIILANTVTLASLIVILMLCSKYGRKDK